MSRARRPGPAARADGAGDAEVEARGPGLGAIAQAFEEAVAMLEDGIARRDYPTANYGMGRCRFHLALYVDAAVNGPAREEEAEALARLQAAKAHFETLAPLGPDGGEPSAAAKAAWLAKVGAPVGAAVAPAEGDGGASGTFASSAPPERAPLRHGVPPGELVEVLAGPTYASDEVRSIVLGPIGSWLGQREHLRLLFNPGGDPAKQELFDTAADLASDPMFGAGFAVGSVKGTGRAIVDTLTGMYDGAKLLADVKDSLMTFRHRELLARAAAAIDGLVPALEGALDAFAARWHASDSYDRGSFRGEVAAYIASQIAILIATSGAALPLRAVGPYGELMVALARSTDLVGGFAELAAEVRLSSAALAAGRAAEVGAGAAGDGLRAADSASAASGGLRAAEAGAAAGDGLRAAEAGAAAGDAARAASADGDVAAATRRRILEPFVGDRLDSARELQRAHPGAQVIAAEARFPPSPDEIARFRAEGGEFLAERFAESLPPGSIDQIYVRYPIPHQKGVENVGYLDPEAIAAEMERVPGTQYAEAAERVMQARHASIESMTNLGPHAIEKLADGGTLEVVYWEKDVFNEVRALAGRDYMDPVTGKRFTVEIVSSPTSIRRDLHPHSGFLGIPEDVEVVSQLTIRKVARP